MRLLYDYGGLWIDADCVTMSDYDEVEAALSRYPVVGVRKTSYGDDHIANNFVAAAKGSEAIGQVIERQEAVIRQRRRIEWGEIGGRLLRSVLIDRDDVCLLPERRVLPIPWQEARRFFQFENFEEVIPDNSLCCMLYNHVFPEGFSDREVASFWMDESLVGQMFRAYAWPKVVPWTY